MSKEKTSIVFTGDIGFDRYMDRRWEDDQLLSQPILDFFHTPRERLHIASTERTWLLTLETLKRLK